jgi:uncharacterized membrane protein YphA (DoxX/SURF4 family)
MDILKQTPFSSYQVIIPMILIMFILSGINKILTFEATVDSLKTRLQYMPEWFYNIAIIIVILLEIIAPIIIINYIINSQYKNEAYLSTIILIGFTILATLLYHFPDFTSYKKSIPFWANVSLIGGLLLITKIIEKN